MYSAVTNEKPCRGVWSTAVVVNTLSQISSKNKDECVDGKWVMGKVTAGLEVPTANPKVMSCVLPLLLGCIKLRPAADFSGGERCEYILN